MRYEYFNHSATSVALAKISAGGRASPVPMVGYPWVTELRGWELVPVYRAGSGDDVYGYGPTGSDYDYADDLLNDDSES